MRIFLGGLLAAALVAAGEWTRRKRDRRRPRIYAATAHIPSILTAAGTTVAYATIYAAYALYEFLVPGTAFVLLGIVALATLAAALLHGPALAALGQVGAFVAPLLVATDQPNYWALYIYLAVVTAASFALARARLWRWLALTAVAFGTLWMFPGIDDTVVDGDRPHAFHAVAGFVLVAALLVSGLFYGPDAEPGEIDPVSSGALAAYLFAAAVLVLARQHDGVALAAFTLLVAGTVAIAWRTEAATAAVPAAAVLAFLVMANWAVSMNFKTLVAPGGPANLPPDPNPRALWHASRARLCLHGAVRGAPASSRRAARREPLSPIIWAATAAAAPLAILIALYYRIYCVRALAPVRRARAAARRAVRGRDRPPHQARAAPRQRLGGGDLRDRLDRGARARADLRAGEGLAHRRARPDGAGHRLDRREAPAAVAALALRHPRRAGDGAHRLRAAHRRRTSARRRSSTGSSTATAFRRSRSGSRAGCCASAPTTCPRAWSNSGAILFTVLTAFLEIRHYIYDGDIYHRSRRAAEIALQVCGGARAWRSGSSASARAPTRIVHDVAAQLVAASALAAIVFGLALDENPLFIGNPVGGPFFNIILLGYGAAGRARGDRSRLITRPTRPQWLPHRRGGHRGRARADLSLARSARASITGRC